MCMLSNIHIYNKNSNKCYHSPKLLFRILEFLSNATVLLGLTQRKGGKGKQTCRGSVATFRKCLSNFSINFEDEPEGT